MILAGDIGGTKVDLALYEFSSGRLVLQREQRYKAHLFAGLGDIVEQFLSANGVTGSRRAEVFATCFGVPGPVRKGKLKLTNLPWEIDGAQLAVDLKLDRIYLINDLEANAHGISELARTNLYPEPGTCRVDR